MTFYMRIRMTLKISCCRDWILFCSGYLKDVPDCYGPLLLTRYESFNTKLDIKIFFLRKYFFYHNLAKNTEERVFFGVCHSIR